MAQGTLYFDYALQVWVQDGVILRCGHPERRPDERPCCRARVLGGQRAVDVPGHTDPAEAR